MAGLVEGADIVLDEVVPVQHGGGLVELHSVGLELLHGRFHLGAVVDCPSVSGYNFVKQDAKTPWFTVNPWFTPAFSATR